MKAFIDCKYSKEQAVALAWQHYNQDQYLKGTYGKGVYGTPKFKGCSVGCMANGMHINYPELFGVIPQIAYLSDAIFEGLDVPESALWTPQLFESIQAGSDTQVIFHKFMHFILVDPDHGVIRFNDCDEIKNVAELHLKAANGEVITDAAWRDAAYVARAAARAAYAAADAAYVARVAYVAYVAARAAYVARAADAAAYAARSATADAREKHFQIMRDKLISLFENEAIVND